MSGLRRQVRSGAQPLSAQRGRCGDRWRGDGDLSAVRRFFCDNTACPRKSFAEQVPGLSVPRARRTPLLCAMLEWIVLAVGGRPGQRLTRRLGVGVSGMTLLRLIRALPSRNPGR